MEITPEASLQIIAGLLKRTPLNDAEAVGAQCAVNKLESVIKEWNEFKKPKSE
jgi:hypothetical protein